ncbi:polyprenyl synthetase, partial [Thauera phenylacetica B4P]
MFQHSAPSPAWLQHDMERVDAIIRAHMNNDVALIRQVVEFILHGAERRRPALVLATARALGHGGERPHA